MKRAQRERRAFVEARATADELVAFNPSAFGWLFFGSEVADNEDRGACTVVSIEGPLEQRAGWFDGYDAIRERFAKALRSEADVVVLKLDSPGGDCAGLVECVRAMRAAKERSGKRVVAYADEGAYSAAYMLASVADEVYVPSTGGVGSVGVIAVAYDRTARNTREGLNVRVITAGARKADGHPDVELSDEALATMQGRVDTLAATLHELVAEGRPLSPDDVAALEAGCFYGDEAVEAGLADEVIGFDALLARLDAEAHGGDVELGTAGKGKGARAPNAKGTHMKIKTTINGQPADELARANAEAVATQATTTTTTTTETDEEAEGDESGDEAEGMGDDECAEDDKPAEDKAEGEGDEESAEGEGDDEGEGDEEDEGDDESARAPTPAPVAARSTRDVLAFVRELTGKGSPAEQIGALLALRDTAAKVPTLERKVAKAERVSRKATVERVVDKAIKAGKLTPAQRAWAVSTGLDSPKVLDGYLASASPVVARAPLAAPPVKSPTSRRTVDANGATSPTPSEITVAKAMGLDPAKLAAHRAELVKTGVLH